MAEQRGPKKPLDHDPQAVRGAREQVGLTRTAVAQELGVSLSLISEIESGTRNATPAMILRLADALRCEPDLLRRNGHVKVVVAYTCTACDSPWQPGHDCAAGAGEFIETEPAGAASEAPRKKAARKKALARPEGVRGDATCAECGQSWQPGHACKGARKVKAAA